MFNNCKCFSIYNLLEIHSCLNYIFELVMDVTKEYVFFRTDSSHLLKCHSDRDSYSQGMEIFLFSHFIL